MKRGAPDAGEGGEGGDGEEGEEEGEEQGKREKQNGEKTDFKLKKRGVLPATLSLSFSGLEANVLLG